MRVLFDSSALFKRYVDESGRDAVLAAMDQTETLLAAPHCRVELHGALARLGREGQLDVEALRLTRDEIDLSFEQVEVLPLTPGVERAAIQALATGPVGAMDALHIGAAVIGRADLFITADRRQAEAAAASGLKTQLIEA
ncbi:MAG: type II toxin-antitoxin system VapC family toxin [Inhella sp.]|uniref:type II toxin-antitoxin system VapC family toxin n=1 Tax=Inhella sp. TaxID=1921806 RepID=UPI0022C4FD88|nr:type II toxin-antitoxin system VapC family toxin [Inhella sp.]MCZ8234763.1 type II toxin-antitoxin system VapC family toxin [Inhella sp.]